MTDYSTIDFSPLEAFSADEVVTHSYIRDVLLPSGKTLALITLDNGQGHTRPNTLGPVSLLELGRTLDGVKQRATHGEIDAVGVTGPPFILAAGADLSKVSDIPDRETASLLPRLGHYTLGKLSQLGVPSFTFINGLALGGGVEIGLNSHYRTIDRTLGILALPEVFLGLIPGWGGATLLPNLIGIANALKVVIENPLKQNRTLSAAEAFDLGIADAIIDSAMFLEDSLLWADKVLTGEITVARPHVPDENERELMWDAAIEFARNMLVSRIGSVPQAPYAALTALQAAKSNDRDGGFALEDTILTDLIAGDQFQASVYAFNLVQKRAKRPAGAPERSLAKPITSVGVLGAGYMATQIAVLFLRRLRVPVIITDIDQTHVDTALAAINREIDGLQAKNRLSADDANRLHSLVRGTTDKADFAGCDFVIEAVYEELRVKQDVFAQVEPHLAADAVLATNTSSLSVEEIGAALTHPERLVGFHFFTPVTVMPLIEVVRTTHTTDSALSTAMVTAAALKKNAVITADTPGFAVNRVLARLFGEVIHAVDDGTTFESVDAALAPLGLPMAPSALLDLVGLRVGAHVLDTHHAAFPDRFYRSEKLNQLAEYGTLLEKDSRGTVTGFDPQAIGILSGGTSPWQNETILRRVEDALADEIHRMLADDAVVYGPEDLDLCMILGAGFPFQMGGITPYLDRVGASERVWGDTFHHPPLRGVSEAGVEAT